MQPAIRGAAVVLVLATVRAAPAGDYLTESDARRILGESKAMQTQVTALQSQINDLRRRLLSVQRENQLMREQLTRLGVDVEYLLSPPPATQPEVAPASIIYESPEALAEYLRRNYRKRVRADMTQLQAETGAAEFSRWLDEAALILIEVRWVFRVEDAWRAETDDQIVLHYASDRKVMMPRLAPRAVGSLEILRLRVERLKEMQKARQAVCDQRTRELTQAPDSGKELAEQALKEARDGLVEVNVQLRQAEANYLTQKRTAAGRSATRPDAPGFTLMVHGLGGRDKNVELTAFVHERDAGKLLAASRESLVKVRGWLTDIALAPQVATVGLRLDHAEVLATNLTSPPPPPVVPEVPEGKKPSPPTQPDCSAP